MIKKIKAENCRLWKREGHFLWAVLEWDLCVEEAAFLTINLKMDHAPSTTIPICNGNSFTSALIVGLLLTKETSAHSVSAYESKNIQNIQNHLQSNSKEQLAQ